MALNPIYCSDDFTITVSGSADADIHIPGDFPLDIAPGANYFIGFTYISGIPAATGWRIAWEIFDSEFNSLPGEERPSVMISPEVPEAGDNPLSTKNGTIRGAVPTPTSNRLYVADVYILQA